MRLRLATKTKNRGALGARVVSTVGGNKRVDEVSGGDGYLLASERTVVIGLGSAAMADSIDVRWPDGTTAAAKISLPVSTAGSKERPWWR